MDQLRPELTDRRHEGARRAGALLAVLFGSTLACGSVEPLPDPDIPLAHTEETPEALGREVLSALARQDRARLEALTLTEAEFRQVVWPLLPASRPEMGWPVDYVWGDHRMKSAAHLGETLASVGGRRFELLGVRFAGATTDYGEFRVHRDTVLEVRDESGDTKTFRVFGSTIEYAGRVKVFSYLAD